MEDVGLILQRGSKLFLMVKGLDAYYIIDVNKTLTYEREQELGCPERCRPAVLAEMGLTYRAIPKSALRGIAFDPSGDCQILYLYFTDGKREKHQLSDDYSKQHIKEFFFALPQFTAPSSGKQAKKDDEITQWRKSEQDPRKKRNFAVWYGLLTALSLICMFIFLVTRAPLWETLCVISPFITLVLAISRPLYFTLNVFDKQPLKNPFVFNIGMPAMIPLCVLVLRNTDFHLAISQYLLCSLLLAIIIDICLLFFTAECRRQQKTALLHLSTFAIAALLSLNVIHYVNTGLDTSEPHLATACVADLYESSSNKGGPDYWCKLRLSDGTIHEYSVTPAEYQSLSIGDSVEVLRREGFLHLEYLDITFPET